MILFLIICLLPLFDAQCNFLFFIFRVIKFHFLFSFLRDLFRIISKYVGETKFADGESETPFVISFMFFRYICPILVNPMKYGALEEISPNQSTTLLSCSKLLNDVALNNCEKYDESTGKWLSNNFKKLCDCINLFIDEADIERTQIIIESSVKEQKSTESEKLLWRKQLNEQLVNWGLSNSNPSLKSQMTRSSSSTSLGSEPKSSSSLTSMIEGMPEIVSAFLEKMNSSK